MYKVPGGWVILQSVPASFSHELPWSNPSAQYFVLKDNVSLFGNDITNPQQSTDQAGQPDVSFGFTSNGKAAFQNVTAEIARRGDLTSGLGQTLSQHFAVALDTQLITVPSIDFKQYPTGIPGDNGADITGGFTITTAQNLATQLRLGALPINLALISQSQVSATLGKQALKKGEIAGLIGLALVIIFLLAYYRVLGLIATGGLIVYALYFFALIKLIPIVLTLPGIAGLILTIGVAADANVVIFERVKEEIRAGRSIRQGIVTGYRKGLTAIIDANVVTIMTAFILFVLATSEVQGFALDAGDRHVRVAVHGGDGDPGDSHHDGQLADHLEPVASRRIGQEARLAVRLHGREPLLLHALGRDPPDRRAGDRGAGPQPRHRLHLRDPDHGRPGAERHPAPGEQRGQRRRGRGPGGAEDRQPRARQGRLPDLRQEAPAHQPDARGERAPELTSAFGPGPSARPRWVRRSEPRSPTAR